MISPTFYNTAFRGGEGGGEGAGGGVVQSRLNKAVIIITIYRSIRVLFCGI